MVFPRFCIICKKTLMHEEHPWCLSCYLQLAKKTFINWEKNSLTYLFWGRIPISYAASFYIYKKDSIVQKCMFDFKYFTKLSIGKSLSKTAALFYKEKIKQLSIDIIVPVPITQKKQKTRGFNQSEIIANTLSKYWNIPVAEDILQKTKERPSQTGLGKWDRWENCRNSFVLINDHGFENKHILLVDDIITSGATIESLALPLTKVPGVKLSVFSLAFSSE